VDQQVGLASLVDGVEDLGQVVGDAVASGDFDGLRVGQELAREVPNVV